MNHTPRLNLPLIHSGQAQKEITHNEALSMLDVLINPVVQDIGIIHPPDAQEGQIFIVGTEAQEEFKEHQNKLAQRIGQGWRFVTPSKWLEATLDSDGSKHRFNGEYWAPSSHDIRDSPQAISTEIDQAELKHPKVEPQLQGDMLINKDTGEYLRVGHLAEELEPQGTHIDTNIQIPRHSIVIAITMRVTEELSGISNFSIGVADDVERYGQNLNADTDTTNIGLTNHPLAYWTDTPIRITANDGSFTGGKINLTIQYLQPHGAWDWD
ncbi:MAG: hypothetical protein COA94_08480 [Rickettsiales bacterium]|nr:MAG: hypothetical protein COA94_08480 [Rickettsiales bacterium]